MSPSNDSMLIRPSGLTVTLDRDWEQDAPWVADWAPGGPNFTKGEHVVYNREINECLAAAGMGEYVAFLVYAPAQPEKGAKEAIWQAWLCLKDTPANASMLLRIANPDGSPRPLDERVYDYVFSLTECKSLRDGDRKRLREKFAEEREKIKNTKAEDARQNFVEKASDLQNRDKNSDEARDARLRHGDQSYTKGADLTKSPSKPKKNK